MLFRSPICKGVSPLTLACHSSNIGHFVRISSTKSADNFESSGFEPFDFESFDSESPDLLC